MRRILHHAALVEVFRAGLGTVLGHEPTRPWCDELVDEALGFLAELNGVALGYHDIRGDWHAVPEHTLRAVLTAMGVAARPDDDLDQALTDHELAKWSRLIEPSIVVRAGGPHIVGLRVPRGSVAHVSVALESGGVQELEVTADMPADSVRVDGVDIVEVGVLLGELPLGYHVVTVAAGRRHDTCQLIVAPTAIAWPDGVDRVEGAMAQLYAVRSERSWGIGDLTDLSELASWSGRDLGFGAVLINPLHAVTPVHPIQRSPYFPSSKVFTNPIYLDPDAVPEAQSLTEADRAEFERHAAAARAAGPEIIDRDTVWAEKLAALELLHAVPPAPDRERAYDCYCDGAGTALDDFATFCALAERYGGEWPKWPAQLQDPHSDAVAREREELADRVDLHRWLQFQCDEQLAAAQCAATNAGMPIGIIHDLAIGVDPGGGDAWAMRADLALGVTVGAPPDMYAVDGQNWSQPPLRPDRLRETGYAAFRDMLRASFRHAGGIRIDHVLGLFRLFWIPEGSPASEGTYVHYPFDEMLGVLVLEATRAGAIVVGEDLGTVPDGLREALRANGVLRSAVAYFQRNHDWSAPLPPEEWDDMALATVNTHDLPTAAGFLTGQRVALYQRLGLLDDEGAARERAREDHERGQLIELMQRYDVVPESPDTADLVVGLHSLLALSPCRIVLAALWDAVCDVRQPNVPGTGDQVYPNWCLPLAVDEGTGSTPITLEQLREHDGVRRVAEALRGRKPQNPTR
jgi:4-alpha-glucanotransferase